MSVLPGSRRRAPRKEEPRPRARHGRLATDSACAPRARQLCLPGRAAGCTRRASAVHLDPRLSAHYEFVSLDGLVSVCSRCHGSIDAPRARSRPIFV